MRIVPADNCMLYKINQMEKISGSIFKKTKDWCRVEKRMLATNPWFKKPCSLMNELKSFYVNSQGFHGSEFLNDKPFRISTLKKCCGIERNCLFFFSIRLDSVGAAISPVNSCTLK